MGPQYFSPEHYGGGVDTATHTIHLALWSMGGSPESAFAQIGRGRLQGDQTIEQFALIVEFDGGRSATLVSSMFGVQAGNTLQIIGRRGNMTTHDRRTIQVVRHEPITKPGSSNGPEGLNIEQVETAGAGRRHGRHGGRVQPRHRASSQVEGSDERRGRGRVVDIGVLGRPVRPTGRSQPPAARVPGEVPERGPALREG